MKLKYLLALTLCLFVGTFALVAQDDKTQPESKYACCDSDTCDDENCPSVDEPEKDDC